MRPLHLSAIELRKQFILLVIIIFIPIFLILIFTGIDEHDKLQKSTDLNTKIIIQQFIEEQEHIIIQTRQFLELLGKVPALRNLDLEEGNRFLQDIHSYYPQYSTIIVSDPDGLIDICAIPLDQTINVQDRSWFQRVQESRDFVIDSFLISRSAKKASLPFAYPVLDDTGKLKAAIGAAFSLDYYDRIFSNHTLPSDSLILVTDRNNHLLYYYSNNDKADETEISNNPTGIKIGEITGFNLPDEKKGSFRRTDSSGNDRIYWFERLSVGDESNEICLIVGISPDILFADINRILWKHVVLLLITAVFSLVTAWTFGHKFVFGPIQILLQKTRRVQEGNLSVIHNRKALPGELQSLSDAFDNMIINLSKREQEREIAEERLRILFNQAADAIYVCDETGLLKHVNRKASEDTGYSKQELLTMHVYDLDHTTSSEDSFFNFLDTFAPGESVILETSHIKKDRTTFPVEITVVQLNTREGLRVLGIARDITQRKKHEKEIKKALSEKETLLQELYHRTKNNMQLIRSMLTLSASQYTNSDVDELVRNTENRIQSMSLVHEMLYQTRDLTRISLRDYLEKLTGSLLGSITGKNAGISMNFDMEDLTVMVDYAIPLGLVMNELITNSIKHAFTDGRSGKIRIALKHNQNNRITLILSDNGPGFPEELDAEASDSLGISLVTGIVQQQLEGTVRFENRNGLICTMEFPANLYSDSISSGDED